MSIPYQFPDGSFPFVYDGRDKFVLPRQFSPGDDVVIIGRGKKVQHHPANKRFRALIASKLESYSNAATKGLKSNILWRVLQEVRGYSPSRLGFVKRDGETGRWYAIDDITAKINISQAFRDGLHSDYKSSKKRKQRKRKVDEDEQEPPPSNEEAKASSSSPSKKRPCIPTTKRASQENLSRLGLTMDHVRNSLVSPSPSGSVPSQPEINQLNMDLTSTKQPQAWDDTFAGLYQKFGSNTKLSDDPFEPDPIAFSSSCSTQKCNTWSTGGNNHNAEVIFPLSAMSTLLDDTTNPPDIVAHTGNNSNIKPQGTEDAGCNLPSILSLSSLDLSDIGELNRLSSISSISECQELQELSEVWDRVDSDHSRSSRSAVLQAS